MIEKLDAAGKRLNEIIEKIESGNVAPSDNHLLFIENLQNHNPFFAPWIIRNTLRTLAVNFRKDHLENYFGDYASNDSIDSEETVLSILPSNNPLAGITDMLRALIFRKSILFRISSANKKFLPAIVDFLKEDIPEIDQLVGFTEGITPNPDVIFTYEIEPGDTNLRKYFSRYNGVVRERKKSAAVLTGREEVADLKILVHGMMSYFGQNRHNISKIFIPHDFDLDKFRESFQDYKFLPDNNKYRNNYDYFKSVYLLNKENFHDNGFVIFKEDSNQMLNPLGVIYYERYDGFDKLQSQLEKPPFHQIYSMDRKDFSAEDFLYPDLLALEDNHQFLKALKVIA